MTIKYVWLVKVRVYTKKDPCVILCQCEGEMSYWDFAPGFPGISGLGN